MFDATSPCKEDKDEDQEIDQVEDGADCETDDDSKNVAEKSRFEKDKVKYKTEVKFHYLITRTGNTESLPWRAQVSQEEKASQSIKIL